MSMRRKAALQAGLLLVAMLANAASRSNMTQIKILDSETRAVNASDNGVPTNCEQLTFDAYCRSTTTPQMTSTLLVQEGDNPPFRIRCTIESKYSRCEPLPKDATFDARREKKGIIVYYVDNKGKARSQLYTFVDTAGKAAPTATGAASAVQPVARADGATVSPAPSLVPPPASARGGLTAKASAEQGSKEKVRCSFTSTPPGADITIDGSYVGNTPSEIGLSTGTHVVVIAKVGFGEWRRVLTVASDSVVNVTAILQNTQP